MQCLKISQKLNSEIAKYGHKFIELYKTHLEFLEDIGMGLNP